MADDWGTEQSKAPFNMAISTLERISEILRKIRDVSCDPLLPLDIKQEMKVQLTRQLFLQSSPLLDEKIVDKYTEEFKKIKSDSKYILKPTSNGTAITNEKKVFYSDILDEKLDLFSLAIQRELQREKYFMPPKKDARNIVGSFG